MSKVKVYFTDNCPYCVRAKNFLNSKNIPFEGFNMTNQPEELRALKEKTGWMTVPQIFINEKLIGGYTDLMALDESGQLTKLLNESSN